jgi:hypothetical protein
MIPARALYLALAWILGLLSSVSSGEASVTRTADGGQCRIHEGVSILSLIGEPTTMGQQAGELIAPQTQSMLTALSRHPALAGFMVNGKPVENDIPAEYREEIATWAKSASCDPAMLLLLVARNMDFAPAQLLGKMTVLIVRRPTGKRASLSIGWPGYVGIVSGMNDAGVSACLLLNQAAKRNPEGDSLGLRLRAILDHATTLDEAVARFSASPTESSNFVLLADTTTAAVVWWNRGKFQRIDPKHGWLLCTNANINSDSQIPEDKRGQHAHHLTQTRLNPDVDWMKRLLTATYMPAHFTALNAQAMVLIPTTRTVHLALYGSKEAALSPWHEVNAATLMAGIDLETFPVIASPAIADPFRHYTK